MACKFLGWRVVPTDPTITGPRAQATLPIIRQCFFAPARNTKDFDSALFRLRKQVEAQAPQGTYFCSLSSRTVVYKGLLTPDQLPAFYLDLADPGIRNVVRRLSPALLDQHPAQLGAGAALPVRSAQRRDQHHQRKSSLAARQGTPSEGGASVAR